MTMAIEPMAAKPPEREAFRECATAGTVARRRIPRELGYPRRGEGAAMKDIGHLKKLPSGFRTKAWKDTYIEASFNAGGISAGGQVRTKEAVKDFHCYALGTVMEENLPQKDIPVAMRRRHAATTYPHLMRLHERTRQDYCDTARSGIILMDAYPDTEPRESTTAKLVDYTVTLATAVQGNPPIGG